MHVKTSALDMSHSWDTVTVHCLHGTPPHSVYCSEQSDRAWLMVVRQAPIASRLAIRGVTATNCDRWWKLCNKVLS